MKKILAGILASLLAAFNVAAQEHEPISGFMVPQNGSFDKQTVRLGSRPWLPFRGDPEEYYSLFSGSSSQEFQGGHLQHVRGGRHDEIAYQFEGANIRSAFTGMPLFRFIPEALADLTLNSSPGAGESSANAAFTHHLRKSRPDFSVVLQAETDRFTSDFQERLGTFSYGYQDYLLMAEGSSLHKRLHFMAAFEHERFADHYRKFWDGFEFGGGATEPIDNITGQTLQQVFEVNQLTVQDGNIPAANSRRYALNSYLQMDLEALSLRLVTLYSWHEQQRNDSPIKFLFNQDRVPETRRAAGLLSLQSDYSLPSNGNVHLQIDLMRSSNKRFDPVFEDNFFLYRDSLATAQQGFDWRAPAGVIFDTFITGPGDYLFNSFRFDRPGDLLSGYAKGQENYFNIAGSITHPVRDHLFSIGGQFERRNIRQFSIGSTFGYAQAMLEFGGSTGSLTQAQLLKLRDNGDVRTFGYDLFGNNLDNTDIINDGARNPTHLSAYLVDGITVEQVEINAGLRYDRFNTDEQVFLDPLNPQITAANDGNILPATLTPASSKQYLSPRLDISYHASERLKTGFTFGQYVQQARLSDIYASRQTRYQNLVEDTFSLIRNTRGTGASPVKSKQIVVSASYAVSAFLSLRSAIYQRTASGYLQMEKVVTSPTAQVAGYRIYTNNGKSTARGLEGGLDFHRRNLFVTFNYAYSDVKGFYAHPASSLSDLFQNGQLNSFTDTKNQLDYNYKHSGDLMMHYEFDEKAPQALRGLNVGARLSFNSGHAHHIFDGLPG